MYKLIRYALITAVALLSYMLLLAALAFPILWVVPVVLAVAAASKKTHRWTSHGTARWAAPDDIPQMLEGEGIIVGHMEGKITRWEGLKSLFNRRLSAKQAVQKFLTSLKKKQPPHLVRLTDAVHCMCVAPTGVGKGVSIVLPHLLTCSDSTVVVDLKGELARETSAARQRMGHRSVLLDPMNAAGGSDTLDSVHEIDAESDLAPDECRSVAGAIVIRTGMEHDNFFPDAAEGFIATAIGFVVCFAPAEDRNLQTVRKLLSDPARRQGMIDACLQSDKWNGLLARWGHQAAEHQGKQLASVIATVHTHMRFLDTLSVASCTRGSTFDPADLLNGKTDVYLVLPPEHLRVQSALLRLWIGTLLRAVVKGGLQSRRKVQFVLDEAASLGHMVELIDAVDKFRAYGVRLLFLYQSLGQLAKCWPEDKGQTLLSNTTQIYFGINDNQTADYVSNRLGEFTQIVTSGGTGTSQSRQGSGQAAGGSSWSYSSSTNANWSQAGRKLMQPAELMTADPRVAFTLAPGGVPPIATYLVRYYEPGFNQTQQVGLLKAAVDAACLFACVGILAVMVTAAVLDHVK